MFHIILDYYLVMHVMIDSNVDINNYQCIYFVGFNLNWRGHLYISFLEIDFLPPNINVEGDCHIIDCPQLKQLPPNFNVGGELHLTGCRSLTDLPMDLKVGKSVYADETQIIEVRTPRPKGVYGMIHYEY